MSVRVLGCAYCGTHSECVKLGCKLDRAAIEAKNAVSPSSPTAATALFPCPCCGVASIGLEHDRSIFAGQTYKNESGNEGWKLRCDGCGNQTAWWHSENDARKAWNARPATPAPGDVGEIVRHLELFAANCENDKMPEHTDWLKKAVAALRASSAEIVRRDGELERADTLIGEINIRAEAAQARLAEAVEVIRDAREWMSAFIKINPEPADEQHVAASIARADAVLRPVEGA